MNEKEKKTTIRDSIFFWSGIDTNESWSENMPSIVANIIIALILLVIMPYCDRHTLKWKSMLVAPIPGNFLHATGPPMRHGRPMSNPSAISGGVFTPLTT